MREYVDLDDYICNCEPNISSDLIGLLFYGLNPCSLTINMFSKVPYRFSNHHPLFPESEYNAGMELIHRDLPNCIIEQPLEWRGALMSIGSPISMQLIITLPKSLQIAKNFGTFVNLESNYETN